ncbi:hypothetical protein PT974_10018 [Cladobotryum mycophilum]|uniref:Integral membrane protein n=1 Tax=Cladobotryum mycophilum TaxID=491253 RepID=A0ABR0S9T4_9HYPO
MDEHTFNSAIIAFWIFGIPLPFITLITIFKASISPFTALRLMGTIPYGIYGGLSIQLFHRHYNADGDLLSKSGPVWISQGIHAVAGILLTLWTFVSAFLVSRVNRASNVKEIRHSEKWRGTIYFCIILLDLMFIAFVTAATALTSEFIPWKYGHCRAYGIRSSPTADATGSGVECRQSWNIRIMAILIMQVSPPPTSTCVIYLGPLIAKLMQKLLSIVAIWVFKSSASDPRRQSLVLSVDMWKDVEKAMDMQSEKRQAPTLGTVFRNDRIAARIASHLHFDDLTNVSMASKLMRVSVFKPETGDRSDRYELLCETACTKGTKAECWVCTKVICKTCQVRKGPIRVPRTRDHLNSCYALCSKCYFFHQNIQPDSITGPFKARDLSAQHRGCPRASTVQYMHTSLGHRVYVCRTCAELHNGQVTEARERREEEGLKRILGQRQNW